MKWIKILSIISAIASLLASLGVIKTKEAKIAEGISEILEEEIGKDK
jgi:hypothetical protein